MQAQCFSHTIWRCVFSAHDPPERGAQGRGKVIEEVGSVGGGSRRWAQRRGREGGCWVEDLKSAARRARGMQSGAGHTGTVGGTRKFYDAQVYNPADGALGHLDVSSPTILLQARTHVRIHSWCWLWAPA